MPEDPGSHLDLLIIGAGSLGTRVARLWKAGHNNGRVFAETQSTGRHAVLKQQGAVTRTRADPDPSPCSNVLVSLPPSMVDDYAAEMTRAVGLWSKHGKLVSVSSTAVYSEQNGKECHEGSSTAHVPRASRMLAAEEIIREAGGSVIRMAGLYDRNRGPHIVYLKTRESHRRPDGLVNLIHYDDAAELCLAALNKGESGEIYLGCDNTPIERHSIVATTAKIYPFQPTEEPCRFTGISGPRGRQCDNALTRMKLGWQPRHLSFLDWLNGLEDI